MDVCDDMERQDQEIVQAQGSRKGEFITYGDGKTTEVVWAYKKKIMLLDEYNRDGTIWKKVMKTDGWL